MAIPAIITNSVTSFGAITTTSTTAITPKLPPSDIVLALTLGTPFVCDNVYLCSIETDADSGDDDTSYSVEIDGDICDDDSVDQQKMEQQFH